VREEGDVVEAQAAVAVDVGGFKYLRAIRACALFAR
jgi:hypothetical protein